MILDAFSLKIVHFLYNQWNRSSYGYRDIQCSSLHWCTEQVAWVPESSQSDWNRGVACIEMTGIATQNTVYSSTIISSGFNCLLLFLQCVEDGLVMVGKCPVLHVSKAVVIINVLCFKICCMYHFLGYLYILKSWKWSYKLLILLFFLVRILYWSCNNDKWSWNLFRKQNYISSVEQNFEDFQNYITWTKLIEQVIWIFRSNLTDETKWNSEKAIHVFEKYDDGWEII